MRVWYLVRDFDSGRSFYKRALGFEETYVDFDDKWAQLERGQTQIALAVGATVQRPVAAGGSVGLAPLMTVTLTVDHRAVDGGPAAEFLRTVKTLL
ncbi:MAG: 2-oxo acid dehydrogenase subunit E2, partial [Actinobacteria bacterium]|nr:2-oxo acid dehydrogenase subunit E2 [Actinomycetota bacterium]